MKSNLGPLAVVAVLALIGAGCGSGDPAETGTAGGSGTADSTRTAKRAETGAAQTATKRDKAVKFADCVRNNGVPDFPDPNAKGEFIYGASVSPAVFSKAVDACKELQPPGSLSSKRSPKQQSATLRFAQCVRDNGVEDFPDPANGEPLVNTEQIPSTDREGGMSILNAAMEKCRSVMAEAAAGR